MENECKVAHHTFGSFPGKSPKQSKLILSEPKNAITHKNEGSKAMIITLQSDDEGVIENCFFCLIRTKEPCVRKFEGLTLRKFLEFCKLGLAYA